MVHDITRNIGDPLMLTVARKLLPIALGAAAGFTYWYFIGCTGGTCPITSTWHISTIYGAVVGATFLLPSGRRKKDTPASTPPSGDSVSS